MVTYFLNWMGPINSEFIQDNGEHWSAGRIDVRDDSKEGYDAQSEYGVSPMHSEDWGMFAQWLSHHTTPDPWTFEDLVETFERKFLKRKIRWFGAYVR